MNVKKEKSVILCFFPTITNAKDDDDDIQKEDNNDKDQNNENHIYKKIRCWIGRETDAVSSQD